MKKIALSLIAIANMLYGEIVSAGEMETTNISSNKWTGLYAGINAGYIFSDNKNVNIDPYLISSGGSIPATPLAIASAASATNSFSLNNNGFIGGGQLGYIRNFHNHYVAGLEADIQGIAGASQNGASTSNVPFLVFSAASNLAVSKNIDYLGTLRGRLGYLLKPNLLISGSGGLSYGGVSSKTIIDQNLVGSPVDTEGANLNWGTTGNYSNTRIGWTAGGNIEWMLRTNWSIKIEYLYYDLGTVTYNDGTLVDTYTATGALPGQPIFTNGVNTTVHFNGQFVRAGLNYHFA
ncbi:MAG: hypothetical protein A3F46_02310 [Legionellales bacterium RIFCSPHIGHO2_12_FULL_42_9]|nr:MAG: hypothetical protein A3F46_02310 [Legionellales bacterium RIFCSPHIGHO2_12_FULL_42_9]